jgi:acetylornithine deacetylase/succinyl-diaminopimelate desuccinylase-like protein
MATLSPVELLQNLIRFNTTNPPGNEADCVAYLNSLLTDAGFDTTLLSKVPTRPNLVTRLKGSGDSPPLLMYGHVDVVTTEGQEWTHPPFEGRIADGYVWGRGALDMKGGIAMMVTALLRAKAEGLTPHGDIVLTLLCDEEEASDFGARYVVENHKEHFEGIRYAIGEAGGFTFYLGRNKFYPILIAEKQVCWMKTTVRGPAGHGSFAVRDGAAAKLARLLMRLDKRRLPVHITPVVRQMIEGMASALPFPKGLVMRQLLHPTLTDRVLGIFGDKGKALQPLFHNTVNATIVTGGTKINVIPSEITVHLDGRLLPGYTPDNMIAEIQKVVGEHLELEILRHDPCPSKPDMGLFDTLAAILREADPEGAPVPLVGSGFSDGRLFARLGIQTYGFLPAKLPREFKFLETVHAADERIPVEAVEFGTDMVYRLLQSFG